tara:strand:+ start:427 stop:891 length:465 start_codon:yes stop_codon:yes gene_type:complete
MLERFKDRIVRVSGITVFERMQEQLHSEDYKDSNCAGLTAYILGLIDRSWDIGTSWFMREFVNLHPEVLVALGDDEGTIVGNPNIANVCMLGDPRMPGHIVLYLGKLDGKIYTFGQSPRKKPEVEEYPHRWYNPFDNVWKINNPDEYYRIIPRG